jgi:hypothetical protein
MMKKFIHLLCIGTVVMLCNTASAESSEIVRFDGQGNGKSPVFTVDGPWTMDWSASSEFPSLASFEMRLHDGTSGEIIGKVVEIEGTGRGLRLFEDTGTYQIVIIGRSVEWDIEILEISEEQAASLKRGTEGRPSLIDSSRRISRRVPESSFVKWRPEGDETLLLFKDDGVAWRISFSPNCPGLKSATAISFVTPVASGTDQYDSILLDDGTRCYFASVTPNTVQ